MTGDGTSKLGHFLCNKLKKELLLDLLLKEGAFLLQLEVGFYTHFSSQQDTTKLYYPKVNPFRSGIGSFFDFLQS